MTLRYCKDCRHLIRGYSGPMCFARIISKEDIVNGRYDLVVRARTARQDQTLCGQEANWFEPKRSLWQWLTRN